MCEGRGRVCVCVCEGRGIKQVIKFSGWLADSINLECWLLHGLRQCHLCKDFTSTAQSN